MPAPVRGDVLPRVAFALALLVSAVVLFLPASGVPAAPPGTDKLVHLLVFAVLASTGRWAGAGPVPLGLGLLAYAGLGEVIQGTVPLGRSASLADSAFDAMGIVLGLVAWGWATRRVA